MSMNLHVVGFRAPDEQWKRMKDVYEACVEAGIEIPEVVNAFFEGEAPDVSREIELGDNLICTQKYNEEGRTGFVVDLQAAQKRYPGLKYIRFFISY